MNAADIDYILQASHVTGGGWFDGTSGDVTFEIVEESGMAQGDEMEQITLRLNFIGEVPKSFFFRRPIDGLRGAFNPIGSLTDKLRVGWLRVGGFDFSRHATDSTALEALRAEGFSEAMIEPTLLLNGGGRGPVNHLTVLSVVSPDYAPPGLHLISVSVVDQAAAAVRDLEERVRKQLVDWFGTRVNDWRLLRVDPIPDAVPAQRVAEEKPASVRQGVYQYGDRCGIASIDTALASGTAAADAVLEESPP